jgi:hypothetical protein
MKKFLASLYVLVFIFGLVGTGSAILFADIKSSGITLSEGPLTGLITPTGYSYSHEMPDDTEGLPNVVNRPTLTISEYWNGGKDDKVVVEGVSTGSLNEGGRRVNRRLWSWDTPSVSILGMENSSVTNWNAGDSLDVTISAIGSWDDGQLELASSTLTIDHTDTAVPFSEPAAMLLIGFGLIGLARFGRNKTFPKSVRLGAPQLGSWLLSFMKT